MVRAAEGACADQSALLLEFSGHGIELCDLQLLRRGEGWQQTRQALGQQGFAAAGWTHEQEVMAAGRGDFQGTAAMGLALHFLQIDGRVPGL